MDISTTQYLAHLKATTWSIVEVAVVLFCLALWRFRRTPMELLHRLEFRLVGLNLTAATLDALFISIPITIIAFSFADLVFDLASGWTLLNLDEAAPKTVSVALAAIFMGDLVGYWRHRLEHSRYLWKAHAMHHSDAWMNWSTIYRFHPINRLTTVAIDATALMIMGFPLWAIALNGVVRHYYGVIIHLNQPWSYGALGNVFVSPAMHRWHHALEGDGVGKNFASVFSLFDRAFGTYYCPGPCTVRLGVREIGSGNLIKQYLFPFQLGSKRGRVPDAPEKA